MTLFRTGHVDALCWILRKATGSSTDILMNLVICLSRVFYPYKDLTLKEWYGIRVNQMPIIWKLMNSCSNFLWTVGEDILTKQNCRFSMYSCQALIVLHGHGSEIVREDSWVKCLIQVWLYRLIREILSMFIPKTKSL